MYGLPKGEDFAFFIGRTLLQACFGGHDLILNFDEDVRVTVTSSVGCLVSSASIRRFTDFRQAAPFVLALVNRTISAVETGENGTLTLKFDNGGSLELYDDSNDFESYSIKHGEHTIVI
jgi:hypothetical protein